MPRQADNKKTRSKPLKAPPDSRDYPDKSFIGVNPADNGDEEQNFSSRSSSSAIDSAQDLNTRLERMKKDVASKVAGGSSSDFSRLALPVQPGGSDGAVGSSGDAVSARIEPAVKLEVGSSRSDSDESDHRERRPFESRPKSS